MACWPLDHRMSTQTPHPLVGDCLDRLERAMGHIPGARRRELVADIDAHLAEALGPSPTDADVTTELERLGDPRDIAEAETPRPLRGRDKVRGWRPTPLLAVAVLIAGNALLGLVGMFLGLLALVLSDGWRWRDIAIAVALWAITIVAANAIVDPIVGRGSEWCGLRQCEPNSDLAIVLALSTALVPLVLLAYLAFLGCGLLNPERRVDQRHPVPWSVALTADGSLLPAGESSNPGCCRLAPLPGTAHRAV
jgi:hypothetical protein